MTTVFITNIPAPYREEIHSLCCTKLKKRYTVIYCAKTESNRAWDLSLGNYNKIFLDHKKIHHKGREIYLNSNIIKHLNHISPSVVIISGYSMPMIFAFLWAKIKSRKIIVFSDATPESESRLSIAHKAIRKLINTHSDAFIGASRKTLDLFKRHGATSKNFFQSHLCADNEAFNKAAKIITQRDYDIMICGQMCERKMSLFSAETVIEINKIKPGIKILLAGDGPLKNAVLEKLDRAEIDYHYLGFVQPSELPKYYLKSKMLFFPSLIDPWGVVANESCAAGTPVITCKSVGAAGELVKHSINGFILPTEKKTWAEHATALLDDKSLWSELSRNCIEEVKPYNYNNAANGILDAIHFVRGTLNKAN